jgi:hypothetical protein
MKNSHIKQFHTRAASMRESLVSMKASINLSPQQQQTPLTQNKLKVF